MKFLRRLLVTMTLVVGASFALPAGLSSAPVLSIVAPSAAHANDIICRDVAINTKGSIGDQAQAYLDCMAELG